jgi:4-hydroxybenzoate polyprenyltransferase
LDNKVVQQSSLWQKLSDFSELVMFQHTVFSLPFILIAMLVAADGWFGWRLLMFGVLAAVTARNYAMGINRYFDRVFDALNPRTRNRPSVDGRVSRGGMILFIIINALFFVLVAYWINTLAFWLSVPILAVLTSYTFFKRFSPMAHLVLGLSLAMAPIAGAVAVLGAVPLWSVYLAIGVMFWVAGFDLLYSLQDMEFDKAHGLHSIPSRLGAQKTMVIARFFHVMTITFWALFVYDSCIGPWGIMAVVVSAVMLAYEHCLVAKDFSKIDKAFFTVNGYLGFVFLICIILGVI